MLNAEKYKDEILKVTNEGESIAFNFKDCKISCCNATNCKDCLFIKDCRASDPCDIARYQWLLSEYKEPPILDEVEREYLSAVCRPYKVVTICKESILNNDNQWLDICIDNVILGGYEYIHLPSFEDNNMYKGMELKKKYTPQELGITCKNNPNGEIKND